MRYVVPESEIELTAIRASGPGGQNVNKVSTAVQLRFDVRASSLPSFVKNRLLAICGARITNEGVLVLKAQTTRSLETNKSEAIERLQELVERASVIPKARKATKPSFGSKQRRLEGKSQRSALKAARARVRED